MTIDKVLTLDRLLLGRFGGKGAGAWPPARPDVGNFQTPVISF
jgi:hypothetical protein